MFLLIFMILKMQSL